LRVWIFFKAKGAGKPALLGAKNAKAYGFDRKDFALIPVEIGEIYEQYFAKGRLNFFPNFNNRAV
jgi:hypothetical protein